jgi:hypothetical protein
MTDLDFAGRQRDRAASERGANWIVFPSAMFAAVMASRRLRLLAGPVGSSAVLTTYVLPACAVVAAQLSAAQGRAPTPRWNGDVRVK